MNNWSLRTSAYATEHREGIWRDALQKVYLSMSRETILDELRGEVSYNRSPLGMQFVKLSGSPQAIVGDYPTTRTSSTNLWIALIHEGNATLRIGGQTHALDVGDILYGAGGVERVELHLNSDFEILTVEIPHEVFYKRLLNPLAIRAGTISRQHGINHVLSDFLSSVAAQMGSFTEMSFHPVETALAELLTYSLAMLPPLNDCKDLGHARHFQEICHSIDLHLGDCELSLAGVARRHNVSPRYVQKIFAQANTCFSQYVRTRRLEQCRKDLSNRLNASLSISEICYNWGFNDLAYFSRAFSAEYGCSPRAYRTKLLEVPVAN
ncbi:helix-turn-helix transcriptional regulator [Pseudoduganella namucuonensis]|uniref:AraC-type DNA-binding protein n=1 Tax=Pseudoduganella namucuonensis TaxID=1035707 RepID=A0A1I7IM87_9BURK|nr:AraC family transcriptional regulator [Pseudoduganella namucuonensis]SFU74061.1 AraC-type DNA-binding protein [Pseudoduganella namucuonensis]